MSERLVDATSMCRTCSRTIVRLLPSEGGSWVHLRSGLAECGTAAPAALVYEYVPVTVGPSP